MIELLALGQRRGEASADQLEPGATGDLFERRKALLIGPIDQERVVEPQQIEQEQAHGCFRAQPLNLADSPEAAHQLLKGQWIAGLIDGQDLAVEDEVASRKGGAHSLDDFGQAGRDFVQTPREDPDLSARAMNLDARAVELVLQRQRRPEHRKGVGDSVGGLRQHRLERPYRERGSRERGGRRRRRRARRAARGPGRLPSC